MAMIGNKSLQAVLMMSYTASMVKRAISVWKHGFCRSAHPYTRMMILEWLWVQVFISESCLNYLDKIRIVGTDKNMDLGSIHGQRGLQTWHLESSTLNSIRR